MMTNHVSESTSNDESSRRAVWNRIRTAAVEAGEFRQAALWVPASFIVMACAACIAGLRLTWLVPRERQMGLS